MWLLLQMLHCLQLPDVWFACCSPTSIRKLFACGTSFRNSIDCACGFSIGHIRNCIDCGCGFSTGNLAVRLWLFHETPLILLGGTYQASKIYSLHGPAENIQIQTLRLALSTRFRPSAWALSSGSIRRPRLNGKGALVACTRPRLRSHSAHDLSVGQALQGSTLDAAIS